MASTHSHVGRFENYNFDRDALLKKVKDKEDCSFLNFSKLATEFEADQDSLAKKWWTGCEAVFAGEWR